jgi:predicted acetyltransferase
MDPTVRPLRDDQDWAGALAVMGTVFGAGPDTEGEAAERRLLETPGARNLVAVDPGETVVGCAGAYRFDLTLPGGTTVPAAGVTNVGVLPTHRRQGLLRALMEHQLADAVDDGLPIAVLDASEASIYGRFGYGLASRYAVWEIDPRRSAFLAPVPRRRLRLLDQVQAAPVLAPLYEAARRSRPGAVSRPDPWFELLLGRHQSWKLGGRFQVVVAEPEGDDPGGYALYSLEPGGPTGWFVNQVREVVAATEATAAALWRYLLDVDLVELVRAEVAIDDPLLWRFEDPRAPRTVQLRDYLFARVLDPQVVLSARRYAGDVDLVVQVDDPQGRIRAPRGGTPVGRLHVTGGSDGASAAETGRPADLVVGITELGALCLGGVAPSTLVAAGRHVVESTPGALRAADRAFPSTPAPFCATRF